MENTCDHIGEMVEKSVKGDAGGFKLLYEHLVDRVSSYLIYRTKTREDALDLTQDVFVDLYKALPNFTYRSEGEFYSFLFTIVRRSLAKYYDNKHVKSNLSRVDLEEESIKASLPNHENIHDVRTALTKLDDISQEIVILHHWSRYTFAEIASLLDMSESAVRVRHHRAKASLATLLTTT